LFGVVLAWYLYYTRQLVSAVNADAAALTRMYARVAQGLNSPEESELIVLLDLVDEIKQLGMPMVVISATGEPTAAENLPFEADLSESQSRERVLAYAARLDLRNPPIVHPLRHAGRRRTSAVGTVDPGGNTDRHRAHFDLDLPVDGYGRAGTGLVDDGQRIGAPAGHTIELAVRLGRDSAHAARRT
jgi:hypothetical protein